MAETPREVQIRHEQEELQFQKEEINRYARQAQVALEMLQEFTGFDFSSALNGVATVEELNAKTTKPTKLVYMYVDLKEVSF